MSILDDVERELASQPVDGPVGPRPDSTLAAFRSLPGKAKQPAVDTRTRRRCEGPAMSDGYKDAKEAIRALMPPALRELADKHDKRKAEEESGEEDPEGKVESVDGPEPGWIECGDWLSPDAPIDNWRPVLLGRDDENDVYERSETSKTASVEIDPGADGFAKVEAFTSLDHGGKGGVILRITSGLCSGGFSPYAKIIPFGVELHLAGEMEAAGVLHALLCVLSSGISVRDGELCYAIKKRMMPW